MLIEEIAKWLREGHDDADNLVDLPWNVKISENTLNAEHPKVPFTLYVMEDQRFIRARVYTGIETAIMEMEDRLKIARTLLILNANVDLVKFVLSGLNEEVVLRVDIDKKVLTKDVFEDVLVALLTSLYGMVKALNLEKEFSMQIMERVKGMIRDKINSGAKRDDIIEFLVKRIGMNKNNAEEVVDEIMKRLKKEENIKGYA